MAASINSTTNTVTSNEIDHSNRRTKRVRVKDPDDSNGTRSLKRSRLNNNSSDHSKKCLVKTKEITQEILKVQAWPCFDLKS